MCNLSCFTAGNGDDKCKCSYTSCSIFKEVYYYLYPFNIEYSLFASAMAYVMWKNVGRIADVHTHHKIKFRLKDVFLGPVLGILLVVAGLATFVVYEMEIIKSRHDQVRKDKALEMHYVTNIVIVTLMSVSTLIGCVIYKVDRRDHVSEKNPTRSLDVALLVGASLGQFVLSYFTTVATVATSVKGYLNRLNLAWAVLIVIQIGLQNVFVIEGLHREPFHEVHLDTVIANPYSQTNKELSNPEESDITTKPSPVLTVHGHTAEDGPKVWRRWILKEVCVFLLMGNVIVSSILALPDLLFEDSPNTQPFHFSFFTAVDHASIWCSSPV